MIRKYPAVLVFLLLCACCSLVAQSFPSAWMSNGDELNGRAWVDMSETERMIYLWGVREAMIAVNPQDYGKWLPRGSYKEIAAEVDRFYSSTGSRDVPLLDALRIIRDRQTSPAKK